MEPPDERPFREYCIAERYFYFLKRYASLLRSQQRQDGVHTCADVLCGGGDPYRAIVAQFQQRLGGKPRGARLSAKR
jgi:hypothetical protein